VRVFKTCEGGASVKQNTNLDRPRRVHGKLTWICGAKRVHLGQIFDHVDPNRDLRSHEWTGSKTLKFFGPKCFILFYKTGHNRSTTVLLSRGTGRMWRCTTGRSLAGTGTRSGRQLAGSMHGDLLHRATLAACVSRSRWRQWMPGLRAGGEEDVGEAVECEPERRDRRGVSPALSLASHNVCMRPVLRWVCAIEGATTRSCAHHLKQHTDPPRSMNVCRSCARWCVELRGSAQVCAVGSGVRCLLAVDVLPGPRCSACDGGTRCQ
jgi:hypothetical protein